jgi:ABC-2 type transport system permease protein
MSLRSILAIARKDALDILLNKSTLVSLFTPIFIALLFTIMVALISGKISHLLIYNPSNSGIEQIATSYFDHYKVTYAGSADDVVEAFGEDGIHKDTDYALGLVVPEGFDASVKKGERPQLRLFVNGNEVNTTNQQVLRQLLTNYASNLANPRPLDLSIATINPQQTPVLTSLSFGYIAVALLSSFLVGTGLVPGLLVEEKEKKTLRMLMVAPASYADVILGKLLVGLGYQLLLSLIILLIMQGFTGNVPLVLLFVVLGSCFALSLGLLAGSIFQSSGAVGGFMGIASMFFVFPPLFTGVLASLFQNSLVVQVAQAFPTYYIADGLFKAMENKNLVSALLLDLGIVIGSTVVLLAVSTWLLRRQAAVAASI